MATYTGTAAKAADKMIDALRKADQTAVKAITTVSRRIGEALPHLPSIRALEQPIRTLERLPRPEEYVKLYFDFVERVVKTQRTYSMDMVKALEPITRKVLPEPKVRKAAA